MKHFPYKRLLMRKSTPLWLIILLLITWFVQESGLLNQPVQPAINSQPGLHRVVRFTDGDTIVVDINGTEESVRLIGIDTPETHKPNAPVQCYGPAASAYIKNLIGTKSVRLEADPKNSDRDKYDRLLRYVFTEDNVFVNQAMIEGGYGFAYTSFPFSKSVAFEQTQAAAAQQKKGLWGNCKPFQEKSGRWQTEDV